ncbi:hypothetical protein EXS65_00300 [Candidatus Peribacteria bacterium]|nr:hypothetical protein [Candidatus Peribacteria bacterium]
MTREAVSTDDEILDQVCILVGPFKIPKTIGDLRVLLKQAATAECDTPHKELLSLFPPYRANIGILEAKSSELASMPPEHIIDPDTRYAASQMIRHLWSEISFHKQKSLEATTKPTRVGFKQRLRDLAAAF